MSLFKRALASIGIGSATVDTKLAENTYHPGELVKGVICIQGGKVEQVVDDLYLKVYTQFAKKEKDVVSYVTYPLGKYRLTDQINIAPNEQKEIPFTIQLPFHTPITVGRIKVWLQTELDIANAVDPKDKDFISVTPSPISEAVFNALSGLGFRIREAECVSAPFKWKLGVPFAQEFEFVPTSGEFVRKLDEIEVVFLSQNEDRLEMLIEVDRKASSIGGFFSEMLEMDETNLKLSFSKHDIPNIKENLYKLIKKHS